MIGRRQFLAGAALAQGQPSERLRVALIGCGGRGRFVARLMAEAPAVEFAAACDVQAKLAEAVRGWAGGACTAVQDFRRVLERKDIDAVLVATPDHWHAAISVLACQAGKHVYVEKPLAHNVREGRAIVAAAERSGRLVMTGTQHRSAPHYAEVEELVKGGAIGEVRMVRVWNFTNMLPDGIGRAPDGTPPAGLDWEMYQGPAPARPYNRLRVGPMFRWFKDYATGTISDFGVHRFDTVHQIMGADAPLAVSASGGRFALRDQGEMPDTLVAVYEYPGFVMTYEMSNINGQGMGGRTPGMRYYNMRGEHDRPHGEAYHGTKGTIFCDRIGYEIFTGGEPQRKNTTDATGRHAQHFVACIRGLEKPRATALSGHRATNIAHLGNLALDVGRKLRWDAQREECTGDPAATRLLGREARTGWKLI